MQDNKALANGIQGWVGGWASARNIDEAGTAVGKAARDVGNFIGRNIRSLFGGKSRSSGPAPNTSSYANISGGQLSMSDFVSKTTSTTLQRSLVPENYFVKFEGNSTTTFGTAKMINTNVGVTTDYITGKIDKSINYQLNLLGVFNSNFEISGSSITLGGGLSASTRLYLGTSITLSTDFFNGSNISINGYEDLNGDNNSSGLSVGIKPASLVYKFVEILYRRFAPILPWGMQYGTVLPITGNSDKMY